MLQNLGFGTYSEHFRYIQGFSQDGEANTLTMPFLSNKEKTEASFSLFLGYLDNIRRTIENGYISNQDRYEKAGAKPLWYWKRQLVTENEKCIQLSAGCVEGTLAVFERHRLGFHLASGCYGYEIALK